MTASTLTPSKEAVMGFITPLLGRMVQDQSFSLPGDLSDTSRVLVVDSGDLSELLFFAPVLNHLKRRFPGMRVTVLVSDANRELIRTMDAVNEMISYEPDHLSLFSAGYVDLLRRLKNGSFNVTFLLGRQFSFVRSLAALASRSRLRVGFSQEYTHPFVNCEISAGDPSLYEAPRVVSFLSALGMSPGDSILGWQLPEATVRWARQMVHFHKPDKSRKLVVVDPGVGKGGYRLSGRSLSYVVNAVCAQYGPKVLLLSNNIDSKGMEGFRRQLSVDLVDLEPKNVKEALALLSRADLVLSGNTDFFHFASNLRVPTVGFFTRHDTANWMPKSAPWVQILQGVDGEKLSADEVCSKIDTLLHLTAR